MATLAAVICVPVRTASRPPLTLHNITQNSRAAMPDCPGGSGTTNTARQPAGGLTPLARSDDKQPRERQQHGAVSQGRIGLRDRIPVARQEDAFLTVVELGEERP